MVEAELKMVALYSWRFGSYTYSELDRTVILFNVRAEQRELRERPAPARS